MPTGYYPHEIPGVYIFEISGKLIGPIENEKLKTEADKLESESNLKCAIIYQSDPNLLMTTDNLNRIIVLVRRLSIREIDFKFAEIRGNARKYFEKSKLTELFEDKFFGKLEEAIRSFTN